MLGCNHVQELYPFMPGVPSLLQDLDTFQASCNHSPQLPWSFHNLCHFSYISHFSISAISATLVISKSLPFQLHWSYHNLCHFSYISHFTISAILATLVISQSLPFQLHWSFQNLCHFSYISQITTSAISATLVISQSLPF